MLCTGWEVPVGKGDEPAAFAPLPGTGGSAGEVPRPGFRSLSRDLAGVDAVTAAGAAAGDAGAAGAAGAASDAAVTAAGVGAASPAAAAGGGVSEPSAGEVAAAEAAAAAQAALAAEAAAAAEAEAAAAAEASRILAEVRAAADRELEAAKSAGYEEGRRQGLSVGEVEAERLLAEAEALLQRARTDREQLLEESREGLVRLAMAVARHIIGREVQTKPETAADIVAQALAGVRDSDEATVLVNPAQVEAVKAGRRGYRLAAPRLKHLAVEADDAVEPGGAVIRTPSGEVDARLATQVKNAEERALELMRYGA